MSMSSFVSSVKQYTAGLTRRDLFTAGSLLALPALLRGRAGAVPPPATPSPPLLPLLFWRLCPIVFTYSKRPTYRRSL